MGEKLTPEQHRVLTYLAGPGTVHSRMLKTSRPTTDALLRRGLIDVRFPGRLSITPAGRSSLSPTQKKEG